MGKRWPFARRSAAGPVADGSLVLASGERLLAYARTADGGWVAGTDRSLHLDGVRLGWHEVDRARWAEDTRLLEVVRLPTGTAAAVSHTAEIPIPGLLPELVRERVTSSIVVSERVVLAGRAGARIMARRRPDGEIRWSVFYDDGTPRDAQVQEAARDAVARLQMRWGA